MELRKDWRVREEGMIREKKERNGGKIREGGRE